MTLESRPFPWIKAAGTVLGLILLVGGGLLWFRARNEPAPAVHPLPEARTAPTGAKDEPLGPRVWTIAIGIDQYQDDAIPPAHGASRAARAVADWFVKTAGWNAHNVLILDDRGESEHGKAEEESPALLPTRANLDWACKQWLAHRVRPDDVVVLFFSGQAVALRDGRERQYLLPTDARAADWEKSAWRLEDALDDVAATGRNPVVCWLDTGPSGRGKPVRGSVPDASATPLLERLVRWPGVAAWLAADGQPAAEPRHVGALSPFTAAVLKALGPPERPNNLHACLNLLHQDPSLAGQGFRTLGGIDPGLTLWSTQVRHASLLKRELLLQRGHALGITALAFSADGSRLISGAQDSTVKFWDALTKRVVRALSYHEVGVTSVALSPDGRRLASGDGHGRVRLWDLIDQREVPAGSPHDRGIAQVGYLPDGLRLIALDMDGKAWLWETANPSGQPHQIADNGTSLALAPRAGAVGFARAQTDGKIALHAPDGSLRATCDGPGGLIARRALATDGRLVAAGSDTGKVLVRDAEGRADVFRSAFDNPIDVLTLSPARLLAIASGATLRVARLDQAGPEPARAVTLPGPANLVVFSPDGRRLAASTASGSLHLWNVEPDATLHPVPLESAAETGHATALAFSPDGRSLVAGDQDGGLRTWDLPGGNQRPRVPSRRGQIAALSVADDGRRLLQVTHDRQAQVWDLQDGRGLQRVEGSWLSGVIAPDGNRLYLTTRAEGDLACVERATGRNLGVRYQRPPAENGDGLATWHFDRLAIAPDGRWVAAGSSEGPLACVWEATTGKLVQTIRGHQEPISAVQFSSDARHLLTASLDGSAKVWALGDNSAPAPAVATFAMTDEATGDPVPITAAHMTAANPRRVVTGGIDGRVLLWEEANPRALDLGTLDRAILAATFTPDGRWLAVGGADKSVWLYEMSHPQRRLRLEPSPQHAEQVNALVAWPNGKLIASGSDDTTIRFWSLADKGLLGTLSAEQGTTDWVAYTPDGLFDSSVGGEKQVSWLVNRELLTLEQVYDQFHVFKLTDQLRRGERPQAPEPPRAPPPRLSITAPPGPVLTQRLAALLIALGETRLENLRLYQNGIPVLSAPDLDPIDPRHFAAEVRLRPGLNRFYVMASRPGVAGIDGRSPVVEVRYDGPEPSGRLHILALGVSRYQDPNRVLGFADRDARQLADFLHERGLADAGEPGLKTVLANDEVSEERVDQEFQRLRDAVKGHPEDTVVVFLAGHADVLNERFCLLLPPFPFAKAADPRTGRPRLAEVPRGSVLPYVSLYRNIARLNALQRLVVVDACQAEAIGDDPGVRRIQDLIDSGAQRARTAYLMGARRGEPASETSALEHGLLTYALLRGMGAPTLEKVAGLSMLDEVPDADRNRDGVITTEELRWFADWTVPKLASNFPLLVQRTGAGLAPSIRPTANLNQKPRLQGSDTSFPLIGLPRGANKVGSR